MGCAISPEDPKKIKVADSLARLLGRTLPYWKEANETGHVAERPLESEFPSKEKEGVLLRVVGARARVCAFPT